MKFDISYHVSSLAYTLGNLCETCIDASCYDGKKK